mmetsp:Transcript_21562/g.37014  ORF Transcript_21562/g.37014 Transcript_21562/m.37014 type:complete len:182 (-) Transcript_21562:673-1218(-)|eukprot:CAMPEP_0196666016 /NCGR_PEP_ID=MMETSP1086-20130531/63472_1 /TAXON_ID=77921 /ORGANISM="Cyanoptyche  gloeocystis , Strain SAG4.97" /LENGTH=181 /DNA_ID=CAMNT_0042003057 /DNA_START=70 /DNA_END=615 /DNA_ORIENTATION=-
MEIAFSCSIFATSALSKIGAVGPVDLCQRLPTSVKPAFKPQAPLLTRKFHARDRSFSSVPRIVAAEEEKEKSAAFGTKLVRVELRKPLGLLLEEADNKNVFVAEVTPGGNADQTGLVKSGDVIAKVSAVFVLDASRGLTETKLVDVKGAGLDVVTKAIQSNTYFRVSMVDGATVLVLERAV